MNENATGTAIIADIHGKIPWILVSDSNTFWPQGIPVFNTLTKWRLPIRLGDQNNTGNEYKISAVLANPAANDTFASFCPGGKSQPMTLAQYQALGDNISEVHSVTVSRLPT